MNFSEADQLLNFGLGCMCLEQYNIAGYIYKLIYNKNKTTDFRNYRGSMVKTWLHWCILLVRLDQRNPIQSWRCHIATSGPLVYRQADRRSRLCTSLFHPPCTQRTSCSPSTLHWTCSWYYDNQPEKLSAPRPVGGHYYLQFLWQITRHFTQ